MTEVSGEINPIDFLPIPSIKRALSFQKKLIRLLLQKKLICQAVIKSNKTRAF